MKLIVGLGNPGSQYQETRHNIGRRVVEFIASQRAAPFSRKKSLGAFLAKFRWDETDVGLAYPETYMNLSGEPVAKLVRHLGLDPATDLLILVDDIAIPFGHLRLRAKGSSGGHNGLKSIESGICGSVYSRLRLGVGSLQLEKNLREDTLKDFVLDEFSEDEKKALPAFYHRAAEACYLWCSLPIMRAMNAVNSLK